MSDDGVHGFLCAPVAALPPGRYQVITQEYFEALRAELFADPALFQRLGELRTVALVVGAPEKR